MVPHLAFDLELDHGRCVGVPLPGTSDGIEALDALAARALPPEEGVFARTLSPPRRRTWLGGRLALRMALARAGLDAPAALSDARGAPILPPDIAASISHKEHVAVALVAAGRARVGVDVEIDAARARDIARRVLTEGELSEIAALDEGARGREVILRFSTKEAVYKALDPFLRRYVAFHEIAVTPRPDGRTQVRSTLRPGEGPFAIEARWLRRDGLVVTTARIARA